MSSLFRRCGCRNPEGKQYPGLVEKPSPQQEARACPLMLSDPKHGRWSYRLSAGFDPITRKRVQVNGKSYATKREAQQARNAAAVRVDAGQVGKPSRVTFAEYLPRWLDRRTNTGTGLRPATVENYRRYIEQDIVPSPLGRLRLDDIRRHHLHDFLDGLTRDGRGAVTVRRIAAVLQGALRSAAEDELIPASPATRLRLPKVDAKHFRPWEPEQVGHFLDVAARHRLGPLFEVAMLTGLRRGELIGLRWSEVDLVHGRARVWNNQTAAGEGLTKTEKGMRILDLDDRTIGALLAWKLTQDTEASVLGSEWLGDGHVFTMPDGRTVKPQYVTRLFDRIRERADLPPMTFHGSRHQNASLMLAAGADIAVVSKRLGHSSVSVTSDIYAHLVGSASRNAANAAASLIPSNGAGVRTVHAHGAEDTKEAASA